MADFKAEVVKLTIEEHPNADALELARVGDYVSIVQKGVYKTGELGVYIPEQAVLPEWVISRLGLEGRLAGKAKNRVKAIKLRGVLSQGLIYPVEARYNVIETNTGLEPSKVKDVIYCITQDEGGPGHLVEEGYDPTEWMGITKYEPVIPTSMNGQVFNASGYTLKYDIENIKKHPDVFTTDDIVCVTEKLHGTWACFGYHPDVDHAIVTSKGLSGQGLAFKMNDENENNLYVKTFRQFAEALERAKAWVGSDTPVYLLGEIYGRGVQDLHYGTLQPRFCLFDIYIGTPGHGHYVGAIAMRFIAERTLEVETVPELYWGVYDKELIEGLTSGTETVSLDNTHMREGIVIKPEQEQRDDEIGRKVLKSVSEQYLLRRGGTEFN